MNIHQDDTANFMTVDDIINFYTHTLQHSNSEKNDLDEEENTDNRCGNHGA